MVIQATALSMIASTSLARRRRRPSQAKARATPRGAGQQPEPLGCIGALDDFDGPPVDLVERAAPLPSTITAIGKDVAQPRMGDRRRGEQVRRPVAVLNVGLMHLTAISGSPVSVTI